MIRAAVGLGGNLGNPAARIEAAFGALAALPDTVLLERSRLYRSAPMGPADQPDYCNAVALLDTDLPARALLEALLAIERAAGRVREGERWGPRTLDLDLLVYGDARIEEPGLKVPHPGIAERAFVLVPLCEIAPELCVPGLGTVREVAARIDTRGLVPWDEPGGQGPLL